MFGLTAGREVQIGLIAQDSGSLHRIALVIPGELLQTIEGFLIHQVTLLDPTLDAGGRAHPGKAFLAFQNLDAVSILHAADAVTDRSHLIAQRRLLRRDIGHSQHAVTPATAPLKQKKRAHDQRHSKAASAQ
ncbi:MAG TPA: hypothetical protein VJ999_07245 [Candidatus Sulfotelmatobacter sp.]|nr:hypothetical protein [Candidatus Sulfotelmatobacter sp.]